MFVLKQSHLRNFSFHQAFRKLANHPFDNVKTLYNVTRIAKLFDLSAKEADELFIKLVKQYCELDEKGRIKPLDPKQPNTYKIPEDKQEAWEAAMKEYNDIEVKFERHKIALEDCMAAKLTAADLLTLEDMVADYDEHGQKPNLKAVSK